MEGHNKRRSKEPPMLVAQITDIHIGFDPGNTDEFNRQRVDQVIARLKAGPNVPTVLLATGDLTDKGDEESYAIVAELFADVPWPVLPAMGNHDIRANFARHFPGYMDANGFVQYVHDLGSLRLIVVDTLEEGRHGGAFCAARAAWLSDALSQRPDLPTYIIMHHPPVESGIEWMTTDPEEPWVERFAEYDDFICHVCCRSLFRTSSPLIPRRCEQLHGIADAVNRVCGAEIAFVQQKPPKAPHACYLGYVHPVLNCDGYVYPCDSCVLNEAAGHSFSNPWRICPMMDTPAAMTQSLPSRNFSRTSRASLY